MWRLRHFMKNHPIAALAQYMCTREEDAYQEERKLNMYSKILNKLLSKFSANNMIINVEAYILNVKQLSDTSIIRYLDFLCENPCQCCQDYTELISS